MAVHIAYYYIHLKPESLYEMEAEPGGETCRSGNQNGEVTLFSRSIPQVFSSLATQWHVFNILYQVDSD